MITCNYKHFNILITLWNMTQTRTTTSSTPSIKTATTTLMNDNQINRDEKSDQLYTLTAGVCMQTLQVSRITLNEEEGVDFDLEGYEFVHMDCQNKGWNRSCNVCGQKY